MLNNCSDETPSQESASPFSGSPLASDSRISAHDFLEELNPRDLLPPPLPRHFLLALYVIYALIMTSATLANVVVMAVIARVSNMRTVTNVFFLSLATSDLLIALVNMPLQLTYHVSNRWHMGEAACKIASYLQGVTIVVSIFTLTCIAIDRYYAICHPLWARHVHTVRRAMTIIAATWALAFLLMTAQLFIQRMEPLLDVDLARSPPLRIVYVCVEYFSDFRLEVAYTVFFYVILYLLPVVVMLLTYGRISLTLWWRQPIGESPERSGERRRLMEKRRIIGMLVLIVVVFVASWLPFFSCHVFLLYNSQQSGRWRMVVALLQLLGYSNSLTNPLIYCLLNGTFKQNLRKVFCHRGQKVPRKFSADTERMHGGPTSTQTTAI